MKTVLLQDATQQIATNLLGKGLYLYQVMNNSDGLMLDSGKVVKQ